MTRTILRAAMPALAMATIIGPVAAQNLAAPFAPPQPPRPGAFASAAGDNTSALLTEQCQFTNDMISVCTVYKEDGSKYGQYCIDGGSDRQVPCP